MCGACGWSRFVWSLTQETIRLNDSIDDAPPGDSTLTPDISVVLRPMLTVFVMYDA